MNSVYYTREEILGHFDDCARQYTFPMLDNGYVALGVARLTAYRDERRWALIIEVVGYSVRAWQTDGFANCLHCFGNCLKRDPGTANEDFLYAIDEGDTGPIFDDENYVMEQLRDIRIRGTLVPVNVKADALVTHGILIDEGGVNGEDLLRSLLPEHRDFLLASEGELRQRVPSDLPCILRLNEWYHPDLASEELPGQNETFQMIADVLVTGDVSHYHPTHSPNTHWSFWPEGGEL